MKVQRVFMRDFKDEIRNIEKDLESMNFQEKFLANTKMILCIAGVLLFFYNREHKSTIGWCVFVLLCAVFVILWIQHERISRQKEYLEAKHEIVHRYYLRTLGEWTTFKDTGEQFLSENSYLEKDLDILGEKSLYQYLCVANTAEGKMRLAEYFMQQNAVHNRVEERQQAVKELIGKYDFRLRIETLGVLSEKKYKNTDDKWYDGFIEYLEDHKKLNYAVLYASAVCMPILVLVIFYLVYMKKLHYGVLAISLLIQTALAYHTSYKHRDIISKLNKVCLGIEHIIEIVQCILEEKFEAHLLANLQSELNRDDKLITGIHKLNRIKDRFSMQRNPYIHIFLQMFFMYDVHCVRELESWKGIYGSSFRKIYRIIGEIESLLSLGTPALLQNVTFANILDSKRPVFQAKDIYHPLINSDKVVSNTIDVTKGINIITGSNMSGKSTFMRTMGINLVLAYAGAPVCAGEMNISLMNVCTCMRVTDDVFLGRSSFYAEVLRIKSIVDYSDEGVPLFIIIDEILKGTNSIDRITGAKEIVKRLNKPHIILFISTHDLEICSLIDMCEVQGNNYHFLERYRDNQIIFDYKIKDGKCNSRNAKYILKMAGLIADKGSSL